MASNPRPKFKDFNEFASAGTKKKPEDPDLISVRVRATRLGYIGLKRRREGDVFEVQVKKDGRLPSWMEPVDGTEIEVAEIPATQETAHLRGDTAAAEREADPDSVI